MNKKCKAVKFSWAKVDVRSEGECWPWKGAPNRYGYGACQVDGIQKNASRAAYEDTFGRVSRDVVVRHKCDNPPCCNPSHLIPGTPADNVMDTVSRGRCRPAKGASHPRPQAKLSSDDVRLIRVLARVEPQTAIARRFGVHSSSISRVVRRERAAHVE